MLEPGGGTAPVKKPPAPKTTPPDSYGPTIDPGGVVIPDPVTTYTAPKADISTILGGDPLYQQLVLFDKASSGTDYAWLQDQRGKLKSYYGSESDPLSVFGRIKQQLEDLCFSSLHPCSSTKGNDDRAVPFAPRAALPQGGRGLLVSALVVPTSPPLPRSIARRVSKVGDGGHRHTKATQRRTSLQALRPALERK